jgi:hypothetical protein
VQKLAEERRMTLRRVFQRLHSDIKALFRMKGRDQYSDDQRREYTAEHTMDSVLTALDNRVASEKWNFLTIENVHAEEIIGTTGNALLNLSKRIFEILSDPSYRDVSRETMWVAFANQVRDIYFGLEHKLGIEHADLSIPEP